MKLPNLKLGLFTEYLILYFLLLCLLFILARIGWYILKIHWIIVLIWRCSEGCIWRWTIRLHVKLLLWFFASVEMKIILKIFTTILGVKSANFNTFYSIYASKLPDWNEMVIVTPKMIENICVLLSVKTWLFVLKLFYWKGRDY